MGRQAWLFALPACGLLLHDGNARAVDFHVQGWDRGAERNGQLQLDAALDLGLFESHEFRTDGLGLPLHRTGGHPQSRQPFQLLTAGIEGGLAAHHRHHPAHTGRELFVFDAECGIGGIGRVVAVGAHIIRTLVGDSPNYGQDRFGAQFFVFGGVTA